jgi:hypothetical protein
MSTFWIIVLGLYIGWRFGPDYDRLTGRRD